MNGRPAGDASGVDILLSGRLESRQLGMLSFAARFSIPPGQPAYDVSALCCVSGFQPLVPLAYRVHSHELGRSIALNKTPKGLGAADPSLKVRT